MSNGYRIKGVDKNGKLIDYDTFERNAQISDISNYDLGLSLFPYKMKHGVPWFDQQDPEYKNVLYSETNLGTAGCGVFAFASVWNYYKGKDGVYLLPEDIANYAKENNISTVKTRNAFIDLAEHYNLPEPVIMGRTQNDSISDYYFRINAALDRGDLIIVNVQNENGRPSDDRDVDDGYWTNDGHYMVVTGKSDDGRYYVVDSMDEYKSDVPISGDKLFGDGKELPYGYIAIDFPNPNNEEKQ